MYSHLLTRLCTILLITIFAGITTGCAISETPSPEPTGTPTPTPAPTDTPTPEPTPTATPTPAPLTSAEIFDLISPAIAFIDTPAFTGSGMLIDGNYIVTNYHVVWPFESVRVVFPDGTEHTDVPVLNWDPLGDMAVVGPIETDLTPLKLVNGEDLAIGSDVYLMGYPGEVDEFPQASITRGLISRIREWEPNGVTYFQTDAKIGGGQSGGVMVSEKGEVIGISNFTFSDADFGLVASAIDVLPNLEKLIAGEDVSGLGQRKLPLDEGRQVYSHVSLEHEWDSQVFILNEPLGTDIEIEAKSDDDNVAIVVRDVAGRAPTYADDTAVGLEFTTLTTEMEAPYFVNLFQSTFNGPFIAIEADHDLIRYIDMDDGRGSPAGQTTIGNLDYPGDKDYFRLVLDKHETVNILVNSILIDPFLVIGRPGYREEQFVYDDDTGGGIFGLNAELTFEAPESGTYLVIVQDSERYNIGGYSLEIRQPYADAPTPMAPQPTPTPITSDFGTMAIYESATNPFQIHYPAIYTDDPTVLEKWKNFCQFATACFVGDSLFIITEEDLSAFGELTLEEYVDLYLNTVEKMGVTIESREEFITSQGITGETLILDFGGIIKAKRLVVTHKNAGFNATYLIPTDAGEDYLSFIDYVFSTFEINQ